MSPQVYSFILLDFSFFFLSKLVKGISGSESVQIMLGIVTHSWGYTLRPSNWSKGHYRQGLSSSVNQTVVLHNTKLTANVQMLRVGSGRTRCLQLAVGVTLANLLLSTILVYLSSSSTSSSSHGNGNQERLLLSVEYPGRSAFLPSIVWFDRFVPAVVRKES